VSTNDPVRLGVELLIGSSTGYKPPMPDSGVFTQTLAVLVLTRGHPHANKCFKVTRATDTWFTKRYNAVGHVLPEPQLADGV
jgi:hypothetical protein